MKTIKEVQDWINNHNCDSDIIIWICGFTVAKGLGRFALTYNHDNIKSDTATTHEFMQWFNNESIDEKTQKIRGKFTIITEYNNGLFRGYYDRHWHVVVEFVEFMGPHHKYIITFSYNYRPICDTDYTAETIEDAIIYAMEYIDKPNSPLNKDLERLHIDKY